MRASCAPFLRQCVCKRAVACWYNRQCGSIERLRAKKQLDMLFFRIIARRDGSSRLLRISAIPTWGSPKRFQARLSSPLERLVCQMCVSLYVLHDFSGQRYPQMGPRQSGRPLLWRCGKTVIWLINHSKVMCFCLFTRNGVFGVQ